MFPAEKKGEWEPYKVRERKRAVISSKPRNDVDGAAQQEGVTVADGDGPGGDAQPKVEVMEEEVIYEEDPYSDEGAEHPLHEGHVVNWPCFFALLTHVYNTLSPPFHTPILLIAQPAWTAQDHETLTQFFFEKFKTPGFCLLDSALAVCYAYGVSTATVVDVGYQKCDVTAVSDFLVHENGRGVAVPGCGGEAMTQRLLELLGSQSFTWDMCEQLKKSGICEILPPGTPMPGTSDVEEPISNPAAAAATGATASGPGHRPSIASQGGAPRGPGVDTEVGDEDQDRVIKGGEDDDGVLDVASIVASGKTTEFLAKKEREKAEKAAAKKAVADAASMAKPVRLPNSKRVKAVLHYDERKSHEDPKPDGKETADDHVGDGSDAIPPKIPEPESETAPQPTENAEMKDAEEANAQTESAAQPEEKLTTDADLRSSRKEIEVGVERFMAASGGVLERIADTIHRTILSVPEVAKRSELWDSLVILGNGSKVKGTGLLYTPLPRPHWPRAVSPILSDANMDCWRRAGFKEGLVGTLHAKYIISPSSATIFTSELPSNISTPIGTGANTPQPQSHAGPPTASHGVNPLLLAATTASNPTLHPPNHQQQQLQSLAAHGTTHSSHGQTPTSVKLAKMPEYFPEWKDVGFDEAVFLGAQVAAKVIFVVDQGLSKGFMTRVEYNEMGPQGIHDSSL